MRIFITGATGFIGSYVAYRLLEAGHELVAIARNAEKTPSLSSHPRVRRVPASLYDFATIRESLAGCDACVHVALGWGDTPVSMLETDTRATVFLLQSCVEQGVKHFIYTSSTAALGGFWSSMSEADPVRPSDYYGATKAASEAYVMAVGAQSNLRCNVIRPGYTFGNPVTPGAPMQPDKRFANIVKSALAGEDIRSKKGDGTQFVWAGDLARLYQAVLESNRSREVYFGLATPFVTWQAVAEEAVRLTGSRSKVLTEGEPGPACRFDLSKIKEHFGLEFGSSEHITRHLEHLIARG
ncbi:MAG TPA: NAD(P)-dependent oxidoreductase [Polyangiaceae bacterium]|nr:NAD(P)-dependent oxidoreductase [Polyangiaceae bacterium]